MRRETSWFKTGIIAVCAVALCSCSQGNSEMSPFEYAHSNYAPGTFSAAGAHGPLAKTALNNCQYCHAFPKYGSNPRFNVIHTNTPSGCETCHKALTAHPTPWLLGRDGTPGVNTTSHAGVTAITACALCHGASLDGVGGNGAPSCMSSDPVSGVGCHTTASPVLKPAGCTSCHAGSPSGPDDVVAPNRNYSHGKHTQYGIACAVCHGGYTSGMATHADGATDVKIDATDAYKAAFNVKVTSFSYKKTPRTCSGVSCHGGQTTPDWHTSITKCTECHEGTWLGTPQYNSVSAKHQSHLEGLNNNIYKGLLLVNPTGASITCTDCHKMDKPGSLHFANLDKVMDPAAAAVTVGDPSIKATAYDTTLKTCITACHLVGGAWH